MKRIFAVLLFTAVLLSFSSCGYNLIMTDPGPVTNFETAEETAPAAPEETAAQAKETAEEQETSPVDAEKTSVAETAEAEEPEEATEEN